LIGSSELSPAIDNSHIGAILNSDDDSSSDDGGDVHPGDTYLPLDAWEEDEIDMYNQTYMEEDGKYDDFLSGMNFSYGYLNNELSPPVNTYNGKGPCLHHAVPKTFNTVVQCVSIWG
jgi:hypothetical protein